jgi:hypothetical protein
MDEGSKVELNKETNLNGLRWTRTLCQSRRCSENGKLERFVVSVNWCRLALLFVWHRLWVITVESEGEVQHTSEFYIPLLVSKTVTFIWKQTQYYRENTGGYLVGKKLSLCWPGQILGVPGS